MDQGFLAEPGELALGVAARGLGNRFRGGRKVFELRCNVAVIASGQGKRFPRQLEQSHQAHFAMRCDFGGDGHHRDAFEILCRRLDHRRPVNVDVLDQLHGLEVRLGDGIFEGIRIDDEIGRRDLVLRSLLAFTRGVAAKQDPSMNFRMQSFNPPNISGHPVESETSRTVIPISRRSRAVPPVETISCRAPPVAGQSPQIRSCHRHSPARVPQAHIPPETSSKAAIVIALAGIEKCEPSQESKVKTKHLAQLPGPELSMSTLHPISTNKYGHTPTPASQCPITSPVPGSRANSVICGTNASAWIRECFAQPSWCTEGGHPKPWAVPPGSGAIREGCGA